MVRCAVALMFVAACGETPVFVDAPPAAIDAPVELDAAVDAAVDAAELDAAPVLTAPTSFAPALGQLCGVGYDHVRARVWIYPCNAAELHAFDAAGTPVTTMPRPGEAANDVDIAFAPVAATIGGFSVANGGMIFVNGETGTTDVHLPDTAASAPLVTAFGAGHVVGGAYHGVRQTLFLVQDNVPAAAANTIAEVNAATGAVVGSFSTLPAFDVSYGDVEVCPSTGNLFLVSSLEGAVAEFTPAGALVGEYALPAGVTAVSGIALGPDGAAWLVGTGGQVWRLAGLPCGGAS